MTRKDVPSDAVGGEEEIHISIEGALKTGGYVVKRVSIRVKVVYSSYRLSLLS